ncbi:MAG: hypothetical protein WC256_06000 [Desulfurivibrionaceae bacterium]|jgi:hypothetical protein
MALDLAYPSFGRKLRYVLRYLPVAEVASFEAGGFYRQTAAMDHSQPCLAVRVTIQRDGGPTEAVADLARGV